MKQILFSALLLTLCLSAFGAREDELQKQAAELATLKLYLQTAQDSLQQAIQHRWRQKQRFVEQRELDKQHLASLREKQQQQFTALSQTKEEVFTKEKILVDIRKEIETLAQNWRFVISSVNEQFEKEVKTLAEANPLFADTRRLQLVTMQQDFARDNNTSQAVLALQNYYAQTIRLSSSVSYLQQPVIPDGADVVDLSLVSFGNIFAYGLSENAEAYMVRQTGKLGAGRYAISPVGAENIASWLQEKMPGWIEQKEIDGLIKTDVLQNSNAAVLISGKKVKASTQISAWLKKGGAIMLPLLGLAVWAVVLIILKVITFSRKHRANADLYETVAKMLKAKEHDKAYTFAKSHKGVVARVVQTCLEHSKWTRASAEKAIGELLLEETPQLNKHLATLAVIAGAAPLLGLLGTVTGMINLFEAITHYGTSDPKVLAGGISEALITTQTGLAIAIPTLLLHNWLSNNSRHILSEMEKHAVRILNRLWPQRDVVQR